jgi:BirA family transcriptional regulator, biotin operon repressor / biotin---[acetyl-CoA-carboxylase] ligase
MDDASAPRPPAPAFEPQAIAFEHVAEIDSTNAELLRRPFGWMRPVALLADAQTAGRGRNGRGWLSDADRSLTMSVGLEQRIDAGRLLGLPLAVGVAVADELVRLGAEPRLKWPNDVYAMPASAKAGGILVEARQQGGLRRIVVGVGLNLAASDAVSSTTAGQPVAALFATQSMPDRLALAHRLAEAIAAAVHRCLGEGLAHFLGRWRQLDWLAGHPIDVILPDGRREPGIARGIDDDGALRVEQGGRLVRWVAGEVSVRRASGASPPTA